MKLARVVRGHSGDSWGEGRKVALITTPKRRTGQVQNHSADNFIDQII